MLTEVATDDVKYDKIDENIVIIDTNRQKWSNLKVIDKFINVKKIDKTDNNNIDKQVGLPT